MSQPSAYLAFADGSVFQGTSFGHDGEASGEVVFNTSMTGYQEILTDLSYFQQIIVMTYPMIGNVGVNKEDVESAHPFASGLIVHEYCPWPSNGRSTQSLRDYLKEHKIVGITGMPTRTIVRKIRSHGACPAILAVGGDPKEWVKKAKELPSMEGQGLAIQVSTKKIYTVSAKNPKWSISAIDYGIKTSILRELAKRDCKVTVYPATASAKEILAESPDGILLSNGPGDPAPLHSQIAVIREILDKKPLLAICLGHQLLALALGGKTYKLKFGHRGGNQPVKDLKTRKVLITAQNHWFAVDSNSLPKDLEITQINLNDQTIEGFAHRKLPILSFQYHPEAGPGPKDANFIFDQFLERLV